MHKVTLKVLRDGKLVDRTFVVDGAAVLEELVPSDTRAIPSKILVKPAHEYLPKPYTGCKSCKKGR